MTKEIYLLKLKDSLNARDAGDEKLEDQILDELDKIWYSLSDADIAEIRQEVRSWVRGG